jgi:hypothetical protein
MAHFLQTFLYVLLNMLIVGDTNLLALRGGGGICPPCITPLRGPMDDSLLCLLSLLYLRLLLYDIHDMDETTTSPLSQLPRLRQVLSMLLYQ